ncbi:MAG: alanine racemase [Gammaproteobacteria bacterium]|nr:MAG: alanine racemase [Gammaproteobacteria bacterium]
MPTTSTVTGNTEPTAAAVVARIDLGALVHNLAVARRHAPHSRVMGVVKSLAYGHGMLPVARTLVRAGCDALAVARMEEALALRQAGIEAPLVVLEGCIWAAELEPARRHDLQLVLHDVHQLEMLRADRGREPVRCWLKFDTGMHRLGFDPAEAQPLLAQCEALSQVRLEGLMTHLANADDTNDPATPRQLARMAEVAALADLPCSIANSAGILAWPESHADWVRPGLMLYGASPLLGRSAAELGLRPVMTLQAPLIAIHGIHAGDPVGYGGTWRAPEDLPLGVVGIGYGDGYPREIAPGTEVLLRGRRVPVVGRVSMDMICVDLRGVPEPRVGDRVVLWGEGLPAEELAEKADTIPYTLFCGVTERAARIYREQGGGRRAG